MLVSPSKLLVSVRGGEDTSAQGVHFPPVAGACSLLTSHSSYLCCFWTVKWLIPPRPQTHHAHKHTSSEVLLRAVCFEPWMLLELAWAGLSSPNRHLIRRVIGLIDESTRSLFAFSFLLTHTYKYTYYFCYWSFHLRLNWVTNTFSRFTFTFNPAHIFNRYWKPQNKNSAVEKGMHADILWNNIQPIFKDHRMKTDSALVTSWRENPGN